MRSKAPCEPQHRFSRTPVRGSKESHLLEQFLQHYGYAAILLGTFLEGETVLILGGLAAHRGYLGLPGVLVAAFVGSLCGTQAMFYLGRWRGATIIERRPVLRARVARAQRLMQRYQSGLMLGYRFLYGMRSVLPALWGMDTLSGARFLVLDFIGAMVWTAAITALGWTIGGAAQAMIGRMQHFELLLFGLIAIAGLGLWVARVLRARRAAHT